MYVIVDKVYNCNYIVTCNFSQNYLPFSNSLVFGGSKAETGSMLWKPSPKVISAILCLTFVIGILCILKNGREIENYFWSSEFRCCFICILFHMKMKSKLGIYIAITGEIFKFFKTTHTLYQKKGNCTWITMVQTRVWLLNLPQRYGCLNIATF